MLCGLYSGEVNIRERVILTRLRYFKLNESGVKILCSLSRQLIFSVIIKQPGMMNDYPESCNVSTTLNLSFICLNETYDFPSQCYPSNFQHFKIIEGVWCAINAIIGLTGNLLTIIAIPYAAKHKQ